jgi:2-amino-4-hydroxy-6-hydroxymethyldihydropteridine diphosphokinase
MLTASTHAYIGLGSNLGARAGYLRLAIKGMVAAGLKVTRVSPIYETEPVETFAQPPFLNMVAEIDGNALPEPEELLATLLRIEQALGRTREVPMSPRTIDLDLLFYRDETRATPFITLPHPRLHQRRFVLVPLADLSPDLIHPIMKQSVSELLLQTNDTSVVKRWTPEQLKNTREDY